MLSLVVKGLIIILMVRHLIIGHLDLLLAYKVVTEEDKQSDVTQRCVVFVYVY